MSTKTRVIIERGNRKYEILFSGDCTKRCTFAKHEYCCKVGCRMPKWFFNLMDACHQDGYLHDISDAKVPRGTKNASTTTKTKNKRRK